MNACSIQKTGVGKASKKLWLRDTVKEVFDGLYKARLAL